MKKWIMYKISEKRRTRTKFTKVGITNRTEKNTIPITEVTETKEGIEIGQISEIIIKPQTYQRKPTLREYIKTRENSIS